MIEKKIDMPKVKISMFELKTLKFSYSLSAWHFTSFGIAKTKDTTYILSAKNSENKTNAVIGTNQVSSDINYSINISYTLESLNQNCIVDLKVISTKFSIKPKSEGFNFGSDRSLESLYKRNIFSNVQRYKSYLNSLSFLDKCIDEN